MTSSYLGGLKVYGVPAALKCGEQPQRLVQPVLQLSSLHGLGMPKTAGGQLCGKYIART